MIISHRIGISRVISGTWKHFTFNIFTCIITYFVYYYVPKSFDVPTMIPSILGTALAFFIGFNNNQSYDRWWEARKIWGTIVNDSRTWARQIIYFQRESLNADDNNTSIKTAIYRHIAFLYALKQNLRKSSEDEYKQFLSEEDMAYVDRESNKANALLTLQTRDLNLLFSSKAIDGFRFTELNKILVSFCDGMGKSERISNTIFPTTYNYYTRLFIWIFIVSITLVTAQMVGAWSIIIGTLIGYVFLTSHKIGQSLLNPFEDIPSGIPLDQITRTIEINLLQTLQETEIPKPIVSVNGEYIM